MASSLPAKIKTPDISPFAHRAAQLEAAKPIVAYWCEYWIIQQILGKGLHSSDPECLQYTTNLMDKLEKFKADHAGEAAVCDDRAGQRYIEQFGIETFERADRTVRADKVTRQTADTFQAAATFLELLNIWGPPEQEILAKIKYAKWNAVRIAKALKEGKDPNESNPKPEPVAEEMPPLNPDDPEVQALNGPQRASIEEVPESAQPSAGVLAPNESYDPYPRTGFPYTAVQDNEVSPLEPSPIPHNGSVGGGYFPEVPTFTSESRDSTLPTAPSDDVSMITPNDMDQQRPNIPQAPSFGPPTSASQQATPLDFYRQAPPPTQKLQFQPAPPQQNPLGHQTHIPQIPDDPEREGRDRRKYNTDDASNAKAQKQARWAISALQFDDVDTAVKQLRDALQTLGAA